MRAISESFFADNPLMAGPLIAMLLFLAIFAVVVVRVVSARRTEMDRSARLPFEEGSDDE